MLRHCFEPTADLTMNRRGTSVFTPRLLQAAPSSAVETGPSQDSATAHQAATTTTQHTPSQKVPPSTLRDGANTTTTRDAAGGGGDDSGDALHSTVDPSTPERTRRTAAGVAEAGASASASPTGEKGQEEEHMPQPFLVHAGSPYERTSVRLDSVPEAVAAAAQAAAPSPAPTPAPVRVPALARVGDDEDDVESSSPLPPVKASTPSRHVSPLKSAATPTEAPEDGHGVTETPRLVEVFPTSPRPASPSRRDNHHHHDDEAQQHISSHGDDVPADGRGRGNGASTGQGVANAQGGTGQGGTNAQGMPLSPGMTPGSGRSSHSSTSRLAELRQRNPSHHRRVADLLDAPSHSPRTTPLHSDPLRTPSRGTTRTRTQTRGAGSVGAGSRGDSAADRHDTSNSAGGAATTDARPRAPPHPRSSPLAALSHRRSVRGSPLTSDTETMVRRLSAKGAAATPPRRHSSRSNRSKARRRRQSQQQQQQQQEHQGSQDGAGSRPGSEHSTRSAASRVLNPSMWLRWRKTPKTAGTHSAKPRCGAVSV